MDDICVHCKKSIKDNDTMFAGDPTITQHYDCWRAAGGHTSFDDWEENKRKLRESVGKIQTSLDRIRKFLGK